MDNDTINIIYGAGNYGVRFLDIVNKLNGTINYFCETENIDSRKICDVPVLSVKDVLKIKKRKIFYIAIADIQTSIEIYKRLDNDKEDDIDYIYNMGPFLRTATGYSFKTETKEENVSWGDENDDKKFFVIKNEFRNSGLFSSYLSIISCIEEAVRRGYIPVVDMQSYENALMPSDRVGRDNAWEYYFNQPAGYSLEDISHSKNITIGMSGANYQSPILQNETNLKYWRAIAKNFLIINKDIQDVINSKYKEYSGGETVLGVLIRGTDYTTNQPYLHPIQPSVNDVILKCMEFRKKYKDIKKIYLATEDDDIYNEFTASMKDIEIHSYQKHRCVLKKGEWIKDAVKNIIDEKTWNTEYLISIGILAKCKYLISGLTSGEMGAMILSRGFSDCFIFRQGEYFGERTE